MNVPFFRSSRRSRFLAGHLLLAAASASAAFVACRTPDPIPGRPSGGSSSDSGAGGSGPGTGSGGIDFGVGEGGAGGEGGAPAVPGSGAAPGSGGDAGPGPVLGRECGARPASDADFTKKALLESAGACSAFQACQFSNAAFLLGRQVTRYADDPTPERLEDARQAWIEAVEVWSETTPSQFGPIAGVASDSYHGRGIGTLIHAWPTLNRCEIEKQIVSRAYEERGFESVLPAARGLAALEYVLFYEGTDTVCSANSGTAKTWATLGVDELAQAKRDFAESLVQDTYLQAEVLVNVWAEDGENFGTTLADYEGYGSEQEALNIVAWSLLYPYEFVRDQKVAPLAGIGMDLPNPMSPYAQVELESIVANLSAFRGLFQGCGDAGAGIGFDDWLAAAGAGDLAQDILQALDAIEARASVLPPLHEASNDELVAFYDDLKVLSDLLKEQLFGSGSVLNLKLPDSAASDTD